MRFPSKENICAVVITYNPAHVLLEEIESIIQQVAEVIIVDNGSSDKSILNLVSGKFPAVQIIRNSENAGIAAALNKGIDAAINKSHSWILQLDQDSVPEHDLVNELCRCIAMFNNENLAMAGCNYYINGKAHPYVSDQHYKKVMTLITSGSLLSAEAYQKNGGYREDFFIDAVDFEYSLRLKKAGFHSIITTKPLLHHSIGSIRTVNFGLFKLQSTNHSSLRRYYRARNTMLLTRKYFSTFPMWIIKYNFFLFVSSLLILLLEKDKVSKIKAIFKGLKEGITQK
ncbi:MAG: glycosyltransferase family 2 protein [Bacteroidota bacterium]